MTLTASLLGTETSVKIVSDDFTSAPIKRAGKLLFKRLCKGLSLKEKKIRIKKKNYLIIKCELGQTYLRHDSYLTELQNAIHKKKWESRCLRGVAVNVILFTQPLRSGRI